MTGGGRTRPRSPWPAIVGHYLTGVLAAAQLGKLSALAPPIAAELQLSLTTVAAAVSLLELGGATLGLVAGLLAARLGLGRSLSASLACLCAGAAGCALAGSGSALLAWRLLEAAGYLGVVVTSPVLVARAAGPAQQATAMALWSTFVPVGIALGAWAWAAVAAATGWRTAMGAGAGLALLAFALCVWAHRNDGPPPPAAPIGGLREALNVGPTVWCLAASFGCYALFEVGLLALLPSYLTVRGGMAVAEAGGWTAAAALATIAGSAAAAAWLRRGHAAPIALRLPLLVSLLLPPALAFAVFVDAPQALLVAWVAVVLNAISGAYPSFAFAWLPPAAGPDRLVRANGLFTQFGASGSLLGPPVMAWFVERFGWPAAAWCAAAVTVPATLLALLTLRRIEAASADQAAGRAR